MAGPTPLPIGPAVVLKREGRRVVPAPPDFVREIMEKIKKLPPQKEKE